MEPRNDESPMTPEPGKEEKERKPRFKIIKLEERIAPAKGGNGGHSHGNGCDGYHYHGSKRCCRCRR